MVDGLILETTFLVDLEREVSRRHEGPAQEFLERQGSVKLSTTFITVGELAAGLRGDARARWEDFIRPFEVLPCTADVCWRFGQTYRYLKTNGLLIGTNDLWIGSTALANAKPLVTRNVGEFRRIPGLEILEYAG